MEIIELLGAKNKCVRVIESCITLEQLKVAKKYVELYTTNIDKDLHKRLMIALTKKESEFNTQDKLDINVLNEKGIFPVYMY